MSKQCLQRDRNESEKFASNKERYGGRGTVYVADKTSTKLSQSDLSLREGIA